ncbi:MAG: hypothetical protein KJN90_03050 [Gammaproteobacteria bacterium]|nr:hypothetical protein [Gammaproteobacteria bacterium]
MDGLNDLNAGNRGTGSLFHRDEIQPYAKRAQRRMLLEQLAMAVLAVSLLLAII